MACSSPAQRLDYAASGHGMQRRVLTGDGFKHIAYLRISRPESRRLHVYIEGDGRPWLRGREISTDPTSRQPLALALANIDSENVLYLGRPCYMGLYGDGLCDQKFWTSARYSPAVVKSMAAALRNITEQFSINRTTLIGYSGGGTLAMLMASDMFSQQIPSLDRVVTIAGNVEVASWTTEHGYLPPTESLDPTKLSFPSSLPFFHYGGADDKNVPPILLEKFVSAHGGQYKVLDAVDHSCCWLHHWPELLQQSLNPQGVNWNDR